MNIFHGQTRLCLAKLQQLHEGCSAALIPAEQTGVIHVWDLVRSFGTEQNESTDDHEVDWQTLQLWRLIMNVEVGPLR